MVLFLFFGYHCAVIGAETHNELVRKEGEKAAFKCYNQAGAPVRGCVNERCASTHNLVDNWSHNQTGSPSQMRSKAKLN